MMIGSEGMTELDSAASNQSDTQTMGVDHGNH